MKKTIIILMAFCLLAGCVSQKKKEDRAYRFFRENPAKLATLCADQYPCKDSISPGKEIITHDTTTIIGIDIPCPPAISADPVFVKCPDIKVINRTVFKRDTIFRESRARIADLTYKLAAEHDALTKSTLESARQKKASIKWMCIAIVEGILILIGLWLLIKK
ncbi:MAG: hypothetical protein WBP45_15775 [Daejeonella sp.]